MIWTLIWAIVLLLLAGLSLYERLQNARTEGFFPQYTGERAQLLIRADRTNFLEMCVGFVASAMMFVAYAKNLEWLYFMALGIYLLSSAYARYINYVAVVEISADEEKAKKNNRSQLLWAGLSLVVGILALFYPLYA